jgi:hypothetical protein
MREGRGKVSEREDAGEESSDRAVGVNDVRKVESSVPEPDKKRDKKDPPVSKESRWRTAGAKIRKMLGST